jgi:metallophosphoesterase superfamily enzyme
MLKDLQDVAEKFRKDFPGATAYVTQAYFEKHGNTPRNQFLAEFGSFSNFKEEAMKDAGVETEAFAYEKKILGLQEEIKHLKKEKIEYMKRSSEYEELIDLYTSNLSNQHMFPISEAKIKIESLTDKKAILHLSDLHLGEVVKLEHVNGVNAFNKDIAIQRMDAILRKFENYCTKSKIDECFILLNGDLVDGGLRLESMRNSDLNELESIFFLHDYLIQRLCQLSKSFKKINVVVIVGNHSRILPGKPYYKEKVVMSYEYLLGRMLKSYFDHRKELETNKVIDIIVPESAFTILNVNGSKFLVTHGDILSGGGSGGFAGIPFYAIAMSSAKLYGILHQIGVQENLQFDNLLFGHLHVPCRIPLFNGNFAYGNGCICGANEYSIFKMKSVAIKQQTLVVVFGDGQVSTSDIYFD